MRNQKKERVFRNRSGGVSDLFFDREIPYQLCKTDFASFPNLLKIRQKFSSACVPDIERTVRDSIAKLDLPDFHDKRIAITAGSRGIPNILKILQSLVLELQERGAKPFIVPAMGSHGGGTAQGQLEILASYGITQESLGVPILSSMEAVHLFRTDDGMDVFCDKHAWNADGIVVCGRVKPHTDFRGPVESGLCKMIVVGLGKHDGAVAFHKTGSGDMGTKLIHAAETALKTGKILFALAILDNPYHQSLKLEAVSADNILARERELLREAAQAMPRLLFDEIDTLIVDYFGKEINGAGMDPNITGRFTYAFGQSFPNYPQIKKIVAMRLTEISHGNAAGVGVLDFIPQKFASRIDFGSTYTNCLTSPVTIAGKIPLVMNNDFDTIYAALACCGKRDFADIKLVRITNTLDINEIWVSENYLPDIENRNDIDVLGPALPLEFDDTGNLKGLP